MITSILAFALAFGLLVLVHEFGHFWVARRSGIAVEKFSIGFGPKLFGFKWKETDFCISLLPLGGFVKMKGETEEEQIDPNDKTAFSNKPVLVRSAVVTAGPVMNLLLSFLLLPLVFLIGRPEPAFLSEKPVIERILPGSPAEKSGLKVEDLILKIDGMPTATWEGILQTLAIQPGDKKLLVVVERENKKKAFELQMEPLSANGELYVGFEKFFGEAAPPIIKEVDPNGAAAQAGLKAGDKITKANEIPVESFDDLVRKIQAGEGKPVALAVERGGEVLTVTLEPKWSDEMGRYLIGIQGGEAKAPLDFTIRRYSFAEAVQIGFKTNWNNFLLTLQVLKKLVTLELSYKTLGGPVRIAYTLAKASASGIADFLYFTAFLSLQLAILNLLPIPVLDGGHLVFYFIEAIRRKPLSLKVRMVAQQVGLVLLVTLILFVTWNDLEKLFFN